MVQVVSGDAADQVQCFLVLPACRGQFDECPAQIAVLAEQDFDVRLPGRFARFDRPREEVAARQNKATALFTGNAAAHHIFPIRGVERQFPNVMAAGSHSPGRLPRTDAPNGATKVGAMPRLLLERLVDQIQQNARVRGMAHAF